MCKRLFGPDAEKHFADRMNQVLEGDEAAIGALRDSDPQDAVVILPMAEILVELQVSDALTGLQWCTPRLSRIKKDFPLDVLDQRFEAFDEPFVVEVTVDNHPAGLARVVGGRDR